MAAFHKLPKVMNLNCYSEVSCFLCSLILWLCTCNFGGTQKMILGCSIFYAIMSQEFIKNPFVCAVQCVLSPFSMSGLTSIHVYIIKLFCQWSDFETSLTPSHSLSHTHTHPPTHPPTHAHTHTHTNTHKIYIYS